MLPPETPLKKALSRPLLFVQGKGGVGKTTVASALARVSSESKKTLLVSIEDPLLASGEMREIGKNLWHLNNESTAAFEEYAGMKIGAPALVKIFLSNRLMRYFVKAAPGIRELTLMGKIWFEMKNFDRIIVDMPATGHGLTMFQSLANWKKLFTGSLLAKDSQAILDTLSDPSQTAHLIVALPEEMPLTEGLELSDHLKAIFPDCDPVFLVNRLSPETNIAFSDEKPFADTAAAHFARKADTERKNLSLWSGIAFERLPFFPPGLDHAFQSILKLVTETLQVRLSGDTA